MILVPLTDLFLMHHLLRPRQPTKEVIAMPKGNDPVEQDNSGSHRMSLFVNDGQYGPFVKANIEYRYRKSDGEWEPTTHYTLNALAADIAYRQWVYQRMREQTRNLKDKNQSRTAAQPSTETKQQVKEPAKA